MLNFNKTFLSFSFIYSSQMDTLYSSCMYILNSRINESEDYN